MKLSIHWRATESCEVICSEFSDVAKFEWEKENSGSFLLYFMHNPEPLRWHFPIIEVFFAEEKEKVKCKKCGKDSGIEILPITQDFLCTNCLIGILPQDIRKQFTQTKFGCVEKRENGYYYTMTD
jgi:hypothetical protein